jgi:translation initiation factor IF-2
MMPDQQQESLKVYELAKELGLDSFALLDKLREINIEVKSHMSSLEGAQAEAVRAAFRKPKASSSATTAKKKAAAASPAGASAGTAAGASSASAGTARKAVKKAASSEQSASSASASTTATAKGKAAKGSPAEAEAEAPKRKVVKRRATGEAEGSVTVAPQAPQANSSAETTSHEHSEGQGWTEGDTVEQTLSAQEPSGSAPLMEHEEPVSFVEAQTPESEPSPPEETLALTNPAPLNVPPPAAPVPAPPKRNLEEYAPRANAPGTKVIFRTPGAPPASRAVEKDEMAGEFGQRRLKIVQAAPPVSTRPGVQPTYRTPGAPGAGYQGGARARGPVAPQQGTSSTPTAEMPAGGSEMFRPMTSYSSKEEEARNKRGNVTRGPSPEEIRIADFRKRELVFQPKRRRLPPGKMIKRTEITEMSAHKKKIRMEDKIVVAELAQRLGEKTSAIMGKLVQLGVMATQNQTIDFDTATLLAAEFGWEVENVAFDEKGALAAAEGTDENQTPRPPVITIMGHVDHGKTSLLDAIRNAKVAQGEAGGITQHIGAYSVEVNGKPLTFLDTPGHEAFASMRSRGANVTDIVVLVVAADDSIMPQTKEAIAHAQNAGVSIIVAANKIDKPDANLEKVKKDLSANNILVEEWGGEVPLVGVSALKKTGIDSLLETIQIQAEMLELKANPDRAAEGAVLEARMERGRGIVADLLVQNGTLKAGDAVVVGTSYGRIRTMTNDRGQSVKEVMPGFPVEVSGLNEVPSAGDTFYVVKSEEVAREVAGNRRLKAQEEKSLASAPKTLTLEELMGKLPVPGVKELNVIVKADVFGTAEAIRDSIEKIKSEKVKSKVLLSGVGVITENDVLLARAAGAVIFGFNAKPDSKARDVAKRENVDVRHYSIIYELLDDVRATMENLLDPIRKESPIGKAEVKQVFTVSKLGTVAGSAVVDGKITRNSFARVIRGREIVAEGKVVSLRRFKDDVSETIKGQECGIGVENYEAYQAGDLIHVFHVELVKQTL